MTEYTLWDREAHEGKEITEEKALEISKPSPCHAGPYGGMGYRIDQVLYTQDDDNDPVILAVHCDGEWLSIPESQNAFMSAEVSFRAYEG